ncbi:caspase family protein [Catenulispora rubra]|uniref:caspase family protein n=1 Tax=Catenulispora rubra TaxID=280293 RepID=UPI0018922A78|nr:caspase family protein [Catenulispora rubra]
MPGRALLIGGAVETLTGVDNDIAAMKDALIARGLTVEPAFTLTGKDATRAAILAAYEHLIELAVPGEPSVVYYSGHGGRALPPPTAGPGPGPGPGPASRPGPMDLQFIVPYDFNESGPGDFRGITSVELSVLQARLTQRTDNVVSIFDCCHSGHASRVPFRRKVTTDHVTSYEELSAHIKRMESEGLRSQLMRSIGNPDAVRIVACAPNELAFEYPGVGGKQIGMLTEALTMALRAAGTEQVSWATLLDGVRFRISCLVGGQRPEAEGPARRLLFQTKEDDHLGSLPVTNTDDGRLQLECAPLLSVREGDVFEILTPSDHKLGDLTVDVAGPFSAQGPVTLAPGVLTIPADARAHRITASAPKLVVSVPADVPNGTELNNAELDKALKRSTLVRKAKDDEPWGARLLIDNDDAVTVADRIGPLHPPGPGGAGSLAKAVGNLETLARAEALRNLDSDTRWAINAKVTCEWGLVENGQRRPLRDFGETVRAGQKIYISVRNDGDTPVYVTLLDIGVTGRVTVLTNVDPSGCRLSREYQQEYVFGYEQLPGVLEGVSLDWPSGLDPLHARDETVLIFVTSQPQDFRALNQPGITRKSRVSPLTKLVDQIASGNTRDLRGTEGAGSGYDVRKIEFTLEPADGADSFLLDETDVPQPTGLRPTGLRPTGLLPTDVRPAGPQGVGPLGTDPGSGPVPRGTAPVAEVPSAVAVRLDELVIHRTRARFGGADVRVDAIVLTGAEDSPHPAFRARTQRFSRIRDGEPLPLDRMLVFHGPVVDYLDIALWVSRDSDGAVDLGELLSDEVATFEMQEALAKAGGALSGLPYAAAAAAMVGVGAIVVNVAYRLLRGTVNDVIGLYRGSTLAGEAFGLGRHPGEGVRRVQDFSFAYSIDDVS